MSLQIDPRAGSKDFIQPLRKLGMEVLVTQLPYGDIAWMGTGPNGLPISVGAEVKRWSDVISCINSGRFSGHQLPGLLKSFDHPWLLIYGEVRTRAADGVLEEKRPGRGGGWYWAPIGGGQRLWMTRDVESWLLTMQICAGIRVQREPGLDEAAQWIKTAVNWYGRGDHKSHLQMFGVKQIFPDVALLTKPPLVRRIAAELPGVGLRRSREVAAKFRTVAEIVSASEKDWRDLLVDNGKRLGTRGSTIYRAIHGHMSTK